MGSSRVQPLAARPDIAADGAHSSRHSRPCPWAPVHIPRAPPPFQGNQVRPHPPSRVCAAAACAAATAVPLAPALPPGPVAAACSTRVGRSPDRRAQTARDPHPPCPWQHPPTSPCNRGQGNQSAHHTWPAAHFRPAASASKAASTCKRLSVRASPLPPSSPAASASSLAASPCSCACGCGARGVWGQRSRVARTCKQAAIPALLPPIGGA